MEYILIIEAVILITFIAILLIVTNAKKKPVVQDKHLVSLRYFEGGSSIGNRYSIELHGNILKLEKCAGNGMPVTRKKVELTSDSLQKELEEIILRNRMNTWGKLKASKMIALDAGWTSVSYMYNNNQSYGYSTNNELPKNGYQAFAEILQVLEDQFVK